MSSSVKEQTRIDWTNVCSMKFCECKRMEQTAKKGVISTPIDICDVLIIKEANNIVEYAVHEKLNCSAFSFARKAIKRLKQYFLLKTKRL